MTTEALHISFKTHVAGLAFAAQSLVQKIDRPGMTMQSLRDSSEVELFRRQIKDLSDWFNASLAALPPDEFPPEEKRLLHYMFAEKERV